MARLLYEVSGDSLPEDPCEVTIVLSQAQLYAGGSYKNPYPGKTDGRVLVDMCVQMSAVALAVITVSWGTGSILNPHDQQVGQVFGKAEAALTSRSPERAAEILSAIPQGTPNVLTHERRSIFNRAMIARAQSLTHKGLYSQALSDLARVNAAAPEASSARQLAIECKNLQTFASDAEIGLRLSTTSGAESMMESARPITEFVKTDQSRMQIAAAPMTAAPMAARIISMSPTKLAPSTGNAEPAPVIKALVVGPAAPKYPVSPYKAFRAALKNDGAVVKPQATTIAKKQVDRPIESALPPQLLPATAEGTSYWLQEAAAEAGSKTEEAASVPDIEPSTADNQPVDGQPNLRLQRDWKTAPTAGKTKFADN